MERVDLCKELNLWNKPLVNHPTGYVDEQPWLLLPPDNFYPISSIRLEAQQTLDATGNAKILNHLSSLQ
ncbi:unnamed protein product [Rotaria sp. Silwood2]|nr:unnamed protein product [Rotaria sp. Silwood2]CAF4441494.1 unnamed protein product [Rotaria sp. Silwood2]